MSSLQDFIDGLGVEYSAKFVPFNRSRNAKKDIKSMSDYSINWSITLKKGNYTLTTDYMQGVGHLPKNLQFSVYTKITHALRDAIISACERGKALVNINAPWGEKKPLEPPKLIDILYSLVMNCSVIDYAGFEEWAIDFGYNPDSIKDNKVYKDCWQTALKMQAMLGDEVIRQLEELYQDY